VSQTGFLLKGIAEEVSRLRSNAEKEEEQLNLFTFWRFRNEQLQNFANRLHYVTLFEIKSRAAKRILIGQLKYP
jgi:hypothetical protein